MAVMPVTAIALIAYSAWAPHYKTCPPCMPDWCNRLAQHPFKVQTIGVRISHRVLGDDGPLDAFQQGRDYSRPICLVRLMVRPLASQARNMGSIPVLGTSPFVSEWKPLTRI